MRTDFAQKLAFICSGLAFAFFSPNWARAGTLIFFDTTDMPAQPSMPEIVTLSDDTGRTTMFGCVLFGSACFVRLLPPIGATSVLVDGFGTPTDANHFLIEFAEPGTNFVSDSLEIFPNLNGQPGLVIGFSSDLDPGPSGPTSCNFFPFCNGGFEDGTIQTAATVRWLNSLGGTVVVDTISFQSDVAVPEPSTVMLMLAGLIGLGTLSYHRRLVAPYPSHRRKASHSSGA
jgi:hypothetical protein